MYPAEQLSPGISTFFFWSLRERGFERATSWQDRDKQMAIVRTLVQLKLFNASIVKLLKKPGEMRKLMGFFFTNGQYYSLAGLRGNCLEGRKPSFLSFFYIAPLTFFSLSFICLPSFMCSCVKRPVT